MTVAREYGVFGLLIFFWSTSWLAIKLGYQGLDPVWGASLRFFVAAAVLLSAQGLMGVPFARTRRDWTTIVAVGLVFFFGEYAPLYWGEQFISSGLTAVLFASMVLFAALGGPLVGDRPTLPQVSGILLGLAGLAVLFHDQIRVDQTPWYGPAAVVLSAMAAGAGSLLIRHRARSIRPLTLNASAMLVGAICIGGTSLAIGETPTLPKSTMAWGSVIFLALGASCAAFLLYTWLLGRWSAHRASSLTLVTPVVALFLGYTLAGEPVGAAELAATGLIWLGVLLVLFGRLGSKRKTAPSETGGN